MLFCFITAVSEPVGDDILLHFDQGLTLYLDDEPHVIGERITSLRQVFNAVKYSYLKWSGRVTGYFFAFSISLIPRLFRALLTAAVYVSNVLLALRLVYGSIKRVLYHPITFEVLFLAMYWFKPDGSYSKMWTMVSVYGIPLFLSLLYCNLAYSEDIWQTSRSSLIFFQLLGLFTGLSNEISGAILISMLGLDWLTRILSKKSHWTSLFGHSGLGIGYLLCFFAPGNFHRMVQAHDATLYTKTLAERMQASYTMHQTILKSDWQVLRYMLILLLLAAVISLLLECSSHGILKTSKRFFLRNLPFLSGGAISILAWGCVSYAPAYGMDFFICVFYIILLRTIDIEHILERSKFSHCKNTAQITCSLIAVVLCAMFLKAQWRWLKSYTFDTLQRQILISAAVEDGCNEVVVPAYSGSSSHPLVWVGPLNQQSQYDTPFCIAYWNTHIIIQPDK